MIDQWIASRWGRGGDQTLGGRVPATLGLLKPVNVPVMIPGDPGALLNPAPLLDLLTAWAPP